MCEFRSEFCGRELRRGPKKRKPAEPDGPAGRALEVPPPTAGHVVGWRVAAAVEEATEDFLAENDFTADFLAQCDVSAHGAFSPIEDLHLAFETFTGQGIDRNELKTLLRGKGYKYTKCAKKVGRGKWGFQGISLRDA